MYYYQHVHVKRFSGVSYKGFFLVGGGEWVSAFFHYLGDLLELFIDICGSPAHAHAMPNSLKDVANNIINQSPAPDGISW